jgi:hypothetical protein
VYSVNSLLNSYLINYCAMKKFETLAANRSNQPQSNWWHFLLVLIAIPSLINLSYAQGVYKWTDANGKVHYGDATMAPTKSKKIAGNDVMVEAASASSASKPTENKQSGSSASTEGKSVAQAFQGLPAERIQKCSGLAKEAALIQITGENLSKGMSKQRNLLEQIRANCTATGFDCSLSRTNPANDRCEPFAWKGKGEMLRANIDGTVLKAGPGDF